MLLIFFNESVIIDKHFKTLAGVMELADVLDSNRSPAPKSPEQETFGAFLFDNRLFLPVLESLFLQIKKSRTLWRTGFCFFLHYIARTGTKPITKTFSFS